MNETERGDDVLRMATADNFRDVAGPGYPTRAGGRVRQGVFYRSNALRLSTEDVASLQALGLRGICDLRTTHEIDAHPDPEVAGAAWHHFDVLGIPMDEVWDLSTRADAVEVMNRVYAGFVTSAESRDHFGRFFRQLATGGPQLFHCSAGKDRTGWAAALLLHLAGVDDATIESDYLLTNARAAGSRAEAERRITASRGAEFVDVLEPTLIADVTYLRTTWAAVTEEYGDRSAYLRDGLGLGGDVVDDLRRLLTAGPADQAG